MSSAEAGAAAALAAVPLALQWRPFQLALPAPLDGALAPIAAAIEQLGSHRPAPALERALPGLPPPLAFALGAALAELEGLPRRRWLPAPPSARLLPAGEAMLPALAAILPAPPAGAPSASPSSDGSSRDAAITVKWKVAAAPDALERQLLEQLLQCLPPQGRLRLDANGGWDLATAAAWAERLQAEPRLQWLEQPLDPADAAGLLQLQARFPQLPLALDEALQQQPDLRRRWRGWQVRRPAQEGDPRPLLQALERGTPQLMLSTGFETGIGRRWLEHLAALQALGPTPVAPGLAPGWQPAGGLAGLDPERVWQAAAA